MAGGMARRFQHASDQRPDADDIAFAHGHVDIRNLGGFLARRDDAAEMLLLQFGDAVGMIGVMMRHQDVGETPPALGERSLDRRGLGCIDGGRGPGRGIMEQDAVIVLEAGKQVSFGWHNWLATPAWHRQATTAFCR